MTSCTEVQELVSAAYDGEVTDADAIATAKTHCAGCAECAAFVSFLGAVRRIEPQPAPEETVSRVLAAVRAETAAVAAPEDVEDTASEPVVATRPDVSAASPARPAAAPDSEPRSDQPLAGAATSAPPAVPSRQDWRTWSPWIAAAAVVLVGAVLVGAQGVRYIMSPSMPSVAPVESFAPDTLTTDDAAPETRDLTAEDEAPDTVPEDVPHTMVQPGSRVAFNGSAYQLTGDATAPDSPPSGTVMSALDSGTVPQGRDVWTGPSVSTIIVSASEGRYLAFERVERTLEGRVFALAADRIDSFASTVGLPAGIPRPTAPDGSPTFVPAGTDDAGTEVFARPGDDPLDGFAVAPGAESPEWTWWQPVR